MRDHNARGLLRRTLPQSTLETLEKVRSNWKKIRTAYLPEFDEKRFQSVLREELGVEAGDVIFVHSSAEGMHLSFSPMVVLSTLLQLVGPKGTLLFPTYPKLGSYDFLRNGEVFNVRKTPSYTGLITELARRHKGAVRSLHPTKSVVAIGPHARELTETHDLSPYPYDKNSPYGKIRAVQGKIIGLGVSTSVLSCVHCPEDEMKDLFPVCPYHEQMFKAPCVDYEGRARIVETYAHDMRKKKVDLPHFMKKNIAVDICGDIEIKGRKFFRADASGLFARMLELVSSGITIYPRHLYERERM
jgi:aminoglycoside 3-N-acetyltransferase